MWLAVFLVGIVLTHAVIWGVLGQMRREGQQVHRYQVGLFVVAEVAASAVVWLAESPSLLLWLAINAGFVALSGRISPPRPLP